MTLDPVASRVTPMAQRRGVRFDLRPEVLGAAHAGTTGGTSTVTAPPPPPPPPPRVPWRGLAHTSTVAGGASPTSAKAAYAAFIRRQRRSGEGALGDRGEHSPIRGSASRRLAHGGVMRGRGAVGSRLGSVPPPPPPPASSAAAAAANARRKALLEAQREAIRRELERSHASTLRRRSVARRDPTAATRATGRGKAASEMHSR